MFALEAADMATLAADCASIIVRMIVTTSAPSSGLADPPPMTGTLPAAGLGGPFGPPGLQSRVVALGVPPPVLGLLGLVPAFPPFGGLLPGLPWPCGTMTAVCLPCPPNMLEKLLMGAASSGGSCPVHALVAHVLVTFNNTIRFHREDMVLTGCSSSLAERHA